MRSSVDSIYDPSVSLSSAQFNADEVILATDGAYHNFWDVYDGVNLAKLLKFMKNPIAKTDDATLIYWKR